MAIYIISLRTASLLSMLSQTRFVGHRPTPSWLGLGIKFAPRPTGIEALIRDDRDEGVVQSKVGESGAIA